MALQGDLHSFALADVLRLLAGTTKTGRLDVAGDAGNGEVWFDHGDLVGGEVTTSPHASRSADVVFEMLRFENGTFRFDEGEVPPDTVERSDVDDAIAAAEDLVVRWADVESVVPSVHTWLTLAEQVDADTITVSGDQWRLLAAVAAGTTPRRLGDRFEMTDLEGCTLVKELVELGLVEVGETVEPAPGYEAEAAAPAEPEDTDDVFHLTAEDGPVVLETRDDALLPEPLPGEGTSFVGELESLGTVDGHSYNSPGPDAGSADDFGGDVFERFTAAADTDDDLFVTDDATDDAAPTTSSWSSYGSLDAMADTDSELAAVADLASEAEAMDDLELGTEIDAPEEVVASEGADFPPAETLAEFEGAADDQVDDDRGSLLKFLSSVKP